MKFKAPSPLLMAAVLAGSLVVAGAMIYKNQKSSLPPPVSVTDVFVPASMQACRTGDDCVVIDTSCGFCCHDGIINAKHRDLFNQMFKLNCDSYTGGQCDCRMPETTAACVSGKCITSHAPQTQP